MALRMIVTVYCMWLMFLGNVVEGAIGMNWGRMANQRLIPSMVVDLFLQNGIREVKVFSASDNVLKAFSGSGIGITITIPNMSLQGIYSADTAREWVRTKLTRFSKMNVDIKYVHIGADPFSHSIWNFTFTNAVDVMRRIQDAINEIGYGTKTKATIPHATDVLKPNFTKPSEAEFRDDIKDLMNQSLQILKENNAPFMLDMFPMHFVNELKFDVEFAFVDGKSRRVVEDDNGLEYKNAFDFIFDSFAWAMKKAGNAGVKMVVGQIGWPTDGYPNATAKNAERFYKTLIPKVMSNKGTPLRPGSPIDVYIHELTDENKMKVEYGGAYQRHWGIYSNDGEPKFKIDLSGQGRDIYPTAAKGVTHMPKRWCIFNGDTSNLTKVKYAVEQACQVGDCTSLATGGSCSHLDFNQNVSYAFNRYFQTKSQNDNEDSCRFDGLAKIVPDNPSTGMCIFPVEVLAAEEMDKGISTGERLARITTLHLLFPLVLLFFSSIQLDFRNPVN